MNFRTFSLRGLLMSSPLFLLSACGGGDGASLQFTANADTLSGSSALSSAAAEVPPANTFQSSDGTTFTLAAASIHLRDIRLDLPKDKKCEDVKNLLAGAECKSSDSAKTILVPGPIVVNLMTGTTTPDLSGLRIPAGTYKRIDFRLEEAKAEEVGANEPLVGYSFLASATFVRENVQRTLEMRLKFSEDARFESADGVEVGDGESLITFLRPQVWLQGLPLGTCIDQGDVEIINGKVLIDDESSSGGDCGDAEKIVKENIKRSGDLRKSDD